ncbi:unnamed protein product [Malus baccata var. baccata]
MLPMSSGAACMGGDEHDAASWTRNNNNNEAEPRRNDQDSSLGVSFSNVKLMLEGDWYTNNILSNPAQDLHTFSSTQASETTFAPLQPNDSSASCSPSQAFSIDSSQPSQQFLPPKSCFSSLLNVVCSNPLDSSFDLGCDAGFLGSFQGNQPSKSSLLMGFTALNSHSQMGTPEFSSSAEFPASRLLPVTDNANILDGDFGFEGFDGSAGAQLLNGAKLLFPPMGAQPTFFQKRRQNSGGDGADKLGNLEISAPRYGGLVGNLEKKRRNEEGEVEEESLDVSGLNYESNDFNEHSQVEVEDNAKNGGNNSNANCTVTGVEGGDRKGKKKGLPAKNLMAERRRRKKLNDRLYMLRSVVPKISKMDRVSILGDAIDYLKELLQRINDLHNELDSAPPSSLLPLSTSFHPLTAPPSTLPCRVKEELCPSSLPSPKTQPKVEVRVREGRTVNIHMFCARRPGLFLSTMRALDNLDLDIQQAVISCFNGFALDVFRAEQCMENQFLPEQIKAVLLDSAGFHNMMM